MAKKQKNEMLSDEQHKILQDMVNKMLDVAADTAKEYDDLDLGELAALSGSITQVHETSPYLNELFKGDSWKRVMSAYNIQKKRNSDKDAD